MRNVLLGVFSVLFLLTTGSASAQIVTQNGRDSASGNYGSSTDPTFPVYNRIKSGSSTPVRLDWKVISHNLGANPGWPKYDANTGVGAGFCDNVLCYSFQQGIPATDIFDDSTLVKRSDNYDNATFEGTAHDFHMLFLANNPAIGSSAYVRVRATDINGTGSRVLTFVAHRSTTGISNSVYKDDIVLYPNPAREAVNVVYDPNAGVRNIAVYNIVGKLVGPVYRPTTNGSAKISLEDMPSGVYFLRLMDGQGRVVGTRRFTRQ